MTQEAETATREVTAQAAPSGIGLFGPAYLATIGVVMTAWIVGLIWIGISVVQWLIS